MPAGARSWSARAKPRLAWIYPVDPERWRVRIVFSASEGSRSLAIRELRRAFGPGLDIETAGTDVGVFDADVPVVEVARRCIGEPLVFVTHLTVEVANLPSPALAEVTAAAVAACSGRTTVAVQAWVSGRPADGLTPGGVATAVSEALRRNGIEAARSGQVWVLSICLTDKAVLLGVNRTQDSLSDWPGGRMRLRRAGEQISRAEFKLEEALRTFNIRLPPIGTAVDFGAAPGGWTRILRSHGLKVTAVDPADLDPRLAKDRGIRHLRTTAGEFLRGNPPPFDVVVNDMRMDAELSSELMARAAARLAPHGVGVLTLKTGSHRVLDTVDRSLHVLRSVYDLVGARQLHHNRQEVTVALRKKF
jgi:23S rRNA (cytidine2498-2'-O)-methyltransferase